MASLGYLDNPSNVLLDIHLKTFKKQPYVHIVSSLLLLSTATWLCDNFFD